MAESSLYAGERDGARVFKIGRLGFDQGQYDLGTERYVGVYRTERFAPAGVGGLINYRRVAIHLLVSGSYTFTVKVWIDEERTALGDGTTQTATFTRDVGVLQEITEELEIEAEGSTVNSDDTTGLFLIEGIRARGRIIRRTGARTSEAT